MDTPSPTSGPAALIRASSRSLSAIAASAGINIKTVITARDEDRWPAQARPRAALRRVLGLDQDEPSKPFPILVNTVEEAEALVERLRTQRSQPLPTDAPQPAPL